MIRQPKDSMSKSNEDRNTGHGDMFSTIRRAFQRTRSKLGIRFLGVEPELETAKANLHRIQKDRPDLVCALELCQTSPVPIAQLPSEILEEIFLRSLPSDFVTPSQTQAPISLTMVCRKWRALALALPVLWSSMSTTSDWPLRVFAPCPTSPNDPQLNEILGSPSFTVVRSNQPVVWMHRAKSLPFRMEIAIPLGDIWFGPRDPYKTWVLQTSGQWSYLRIHAASSKIAVLLTETLPKVQTLELVGRYKANHDSGMSYTCRADFDLEPGNFCFPWISLTTFEASKTWIIVDQLLAILKGCPNLQICRAKIQDLYTVGRFPYITQNTIHTTLLTLELRSSCDYPFKRLIDSLTTPSLTTLRCINHRKQNKWPHTNIVDFAKRSCCPLRTIYVRNLWVEKDAAVQSARAMLSAFPTLEEVDFEP